MTTECDVLIVGAGHGGTQAAIALRQQKFAGHVVMVGNEPCLPYDRPALSKEYLAGERAFERMLLRPATYWTDQKIEVRTGVGVVSLDATHNKVMLSDETSLRYGSLIWATGGQPRKLNCQGANLPGMHVIRSLANIDQLKSELPGVRQVAIIGGGYVGLEAAAVMSKLGKQVTVIETLDRVLARVAGEQISRFYEAEHRAHGVKMLLNTKLDHIAEKNGRVAGVSLSNGEVIDAQMVIVGIGIVPLVEPLIAAGARGENGVSVDEYCQTSLPSIYAIGDCALHANPFADQPFIRLESVQNANDMAATVAKSIVGTPAPYRAVPWFWSNQYDLRLQTVGLSQGHDRVVIRGDIAARSFSLIYGRADKVIALDCINATKDYVQGRALVQNHAPFDASTLADVTVPLKPVNSK